MDKRHFSYQAGSLDAGYYVNFILNTDPQSIARLRTKFKLDPDVYRQHYQRVEHQNEKAPKKVAGSK
jgi:ribosomal protein S6